MEIGYQLNGRFLPTIEFIMVDEMKLQPLMAHVTIPPVIGSRQTGRCVWMMRKGPIFGAISVRIEEVYRRDYQRRRFHEIFKNRQLVDFYIPEHGEPDYDLYFIFDDSFKKSVVCMYTSSKVTYTCQKAS